jgi:pimeloyl-ACP methyl ester carboxylesterase
MRGHGRSSHVHHSHTYENYANDVNKFIVELGLEKVIIAGWSMGALVALSNFKQFGAENIKAFVFKDLPEEENLKWIFDELTLIPESIASTILFNGTVQDYREVLPGVTVPTLLCFGKDDKTVLFAAGEHLEKNMPNARLLAFENSCHCPFLEEPDKFNKEVDQFIKSLG